MQALVVSLIPGTTKERKKEEKKEKKKERNISRIRRVMIETKKREVARWKIIYHQIGIGASNNLTIQMMLQHE